MQLFGQIYLDEKELLIGHLGIDENKHARFHLFSYPEHANQELLTFIDYLPEKTRDFNPCDESGFFFNFFACSHSFLNMCLI
ncbi:hypothetical protein GCM10022297_05360 [Lactobacillus hamsteri]